MNSEHKNKQEVLNPSPLGVCSRIREATQEVTEHARTEIPIQEAEEDARGLEFITQKKNNKQDQDSLNRVEVVRGLCVWVLMFLCRKNHENRGTGLPIRVSTSV